MIFSIRQPCACEIRIRDLSGNGKAQRVLAGGNTAVAIGDVIQAGDLDVIPKRDQDIVIGATSVFMNCDLPRRIASANKRCRHIESGDVIVVSTLAEGDRCAENDEQKESERGRSHRGPFDYH